MDDIESQAAELVAALEQMLASHHACPVAVDLEVWAAWHGLGR